MYDWIFFIIIIYVLLFLVAYILAKSDIGVFSRFAMILFYPMILLMAGCILLFELLFVKKN